MATSTARTPGRIGIRVDERVAVLTATGLIALHVVDDAFAQPQPGTSAGDHLAGGLVPLAVLGLMVAALPRAGAGVRAVLVMLLGYLGLLAGSEAAYFTVADGPSGDDFTGIASLLAGAFLVVVGARALWRSRRRDGSRRRRYGRRALLGAAAVVAGFLVLLPVGIAYGATHIASADVPGPAALGVAHEEVTLTTSDGLALPGWYVPSRNGAAVVALGMSRESPLRHVRMLARHGYGVVVFDPRGWGAAEGDPNAFGWRGARDVAAAVRFLAARPEVDPGRIGGLGLSVGGEVMMTAASGSDALAAVVSEGAGERSTAEYVDAAEGLDWLTLPSSLVHTAAVAVFSDGMPPTGLSDAAGAIPPRPLLLIYGERGQALEKRLNPVYATAAGPSAELWEVPGSGHMGGLEAAPAEYERRVVGFFDAALR